jgi:catechol 2,3-dioxygenase-like lactoylglutathione lyase family enzyme
VITAMPRIAIAVNDFAAAVATFRDVLGMPVADFSPHTAPTLGAHVGMCIPPGGSNIELMAPADPTKPLSQALQTFLDRRGEGPYALMLEAPDPDAEAVELAGRGLDVLALMPGAGGRDVHPRSTHGVLVRVYPNDSASTGDVAASGHLGLSGIAKVVVATADASIAAMAYGEGFGLEVEPAVDDAERGVRCVVCRPPKGGVIELVSAVDMSKSFARAIQRCVKEQHGGMYALVLTTADVERAGACLADAGFVAPGAPQNEATIFGARFLLEPPRLDHTVGSEGTREWA